MWRKENFVHWWWECKLVQPLWKTVQRFLKKLKIAQSYEPAIPWLGIYGKTLMKNYMHTNVIAALFIIAKAWKQSKCLSIDEWTHKM